MDWSEQSSHIRLLYRPWQPDDGYDEASIREVKVRLDVAALASLDDCAILTSKKNHPSPEGKETGEVRLS